MLTEVVINCARANARKAKAVETATQRVRRKPKPTSFFLFLFFVFPSLLLFCPPAFLLFSTVSLFTIVMLLFVFQLCIQMTFVENHPFCILRLLRPVVICVLCWIFRGSVVSSEAIRRRARMTEKSKRWPTGRSVKTTPVTSSIITYPLATFSGSLQERMMGVMIKDVGVITMCSLPENEIRRSKFCPRPRERHVSCPTCHVTQHWPMRFWARSIFQATAQAWSEFCSSFESPRCFHSRVVRERLKRD